MKLVIQRVNPFSTKIAKKAKQHGIKLIYETDDDFLDMNSSNPSFNYIQGNLANIKKLHKLRIFSDEEGKINRSIEDVGGEVLVVSQFTLYADCKKGNRPSFTQAGSPAEAERLYEYFLEECRKEIGKVEHGIFGAEMKVSLENDGPFTVIWDSREW